MAKFLISGVIVKAPKKYTVGKGSVDCISIQVEENTKGVYEQKAKIYELKFYGKTATLVPNSLNLVGQPIVAIGTVRATEYKDRFYYDLSVDQVTFITLKTFKGDRPYQSKLTQEEVNEVTNEVSNDDDDLPF